MSSARPEISHWLSDKGYTEVQIEKILRQLDRYDEQVKRESFFDDLASGDFDMAAIIKEALEEPGGESP